MIDWPAAKAGKLIITSFSVEPVNFSTAVPLTFIEPCKISIWFKDWIWNVIAWVETLPEFLTFQIFIPKSLKQLMFGFEASTTKLGGFKATKLTIFVVLPFTLLFVHLAVQP